VRVNKELYYATNTHRSPYRLLFAENCPREASNWENVKKLKPGTNVRVLLWSGQELSGAVDAMSAVGLRLATVGSNGPESAGSAISTARASGGLCAFASPTCHIQTRMIRSAVAGGAIGLTAGAVSDVNTAKLPLVRSALGGADLGFFASCAALTASGLSTSRRQCGRKSCVEDQGNNPVHYGNFGPL